ncbi:GNAT family N-acetyltransferase [Desulfofundulus thermobenzoicus]|uniref:GNAT family N-acetyltransferase n=1 Tax=Desulfofundulus thermobenzoicus TaxID=29376 RepID=A0A6N7ILG2_9FIRM|nr:GNAT family N-acetyltransferase [Desulfofundulus thermobenzoicus]MQL50820.1 GNAT family N-acetyltransferase [Desulfofundulus thermobenzoicus]
MLPWEQYNFYLYYPEEAAREGRRFVQGLPGVANVPWFFCQAFISSFDELGEINPDYQGFQKMAENFVLLMADRKGRSCGFCVFIPEKAGLIQIDIILIHRELRKRGLGRLLLGYLEQACTRGCILYVRDVTCVGRKFFTSCGFARDVDLFKVLNNHNRIIKPVTPVNVPALACV